MNVWEIETNSIDGIKLTAPANLILVNPNIELLNNVGTTSVLFFGLNIGTYNVYEIENNPSIYYVPLIDYGNTKLLFLKVDTGIMSTGGGVNKLDINKSSWFGGGSSYGGGGTHPFKTFA